MVRISWDVSNLTAIYDNGAVCDGCCEPDTNEACFGCTTAPTFGYVSLAGFADCACTDYPDAGSPVVKDRSSSGIANALAGLYKVELGAADITVFFACNAPLCSYNSSRMASCTGDGDGESSVSYQGDFGTTTRFNSTDGTCSGGTFATKNWDRLVIQVCFLTGIRIGAGIQNRADDFSTCIASEWQQVFQGDITYLGGESCGDTDEIATNTLPCIGTFPPQALTPHTFGTVSGGTAKFLIEHPCNTANDWNVAIPYFKHDYVIDELDDNNCYGAINDVTGGPHPQLNPTDWKKVP